MTAGVVLTFRAGAMGIADLGDELVVATQPADSWSLGAAKVNPRAPRLMVPSNTR